MPEQLSQAGGDGSPGYPRIPGWAQGRPYAALVFCLGLFGLQVAVWVALFLVLMVFRTPEPLSDTLVAVLRWAMMLIPLGAAYGLYLGTRTPPADHARLPHVLGILVNAGYLAYGIYLWLMMLMDLAA